ncbi:flagellar biosynthesis anti-sigma factor FlgM [Lacrimispora saccharolytica]|uniref:Anti-sigma-28 factor, FlgM n=1 Tax=Lacrimispora saccharolytica (strain ATCC 35040 / DSM 2544 / NRCC 2533 / WM1) TaxID=610130 RepID=D9R9Y1_LACSW|nr:flagellar biosynthesis anti-sigma factor FlgM [Lacrimispora saccharolytica]ADL05953.1 anti-sigma-28 factor, FlgM [[Clostridium] saccharolyticum WM1]QRV19917.1 flagellar biosynthesis anti-sigma factor FlgM [Lacrimispora saccharolytica]
MRISSNFFNTLYNTSMIRQNQDQTGTNASESAKNKYDEITIRSASLETMDSKFAAEIKNLLMKEVKQPSSGDKLDSLKKRIEDGTYQVDANKIAEKILLYKGADFHE